MAFTAKDLSKKYYPRLWPIGRLVALVKAGKLSEADYKEITGFTYPATSAPAEESKDTKNDASETTEDSTSRNNN